MGNADYQMMQKKNPYSYDRFEYDMELHIYYDDQMNSYTQQELDFLQKKYEQSQLQQNRQEENSSLLANDMNASLLESGSKEEMAALYENDTQVEIAESVKEDIQEVNIKKDSVLSVGGDPVPEPKYIGWDQAFTVRQKDDSEKMADIRASLAHYHKVKGSLYEGDALRNLITSCNTYTWMKIPFLKFGKAKTRLNEVKALRARAMQELEKSWYKDISLKDVKDREENRQEKSDENNLIYNEKIDKFEQALYMKASIGQKVVGGLAAVFGTLILTPLKMAAYPFKAMAYGVDKLYRYVEKKFDVRDTRRELNMSVKGWGPGAYLGGVLIKMHDPFFATSTDKKVKELSEKDDASLYEISEESQELEEIRDTAQDLLEYKNQLKEEYNKKNPNPDEIDRLLGKIRMYQDSVNDYLEDHPDAGLSLEEHAPLDAELHKIKVAYDEHILAQKMEEEYRERDIATQQEIRDKTKTQEGRKAFKEEMRQVAMKNTYVRVKNDDMDLTKRDEDYDEKKLQKLLDEFEGFDIKKINFTNHVDMLKDYEKNMTYFEQSRATHYQLMRGLNRGLKIDDERLIRLRAKFTAMFEMQEYLVKLNRLVVSEGLDLSGDPEEIREAVVNTIDGKLLDRYHATLGDNDAFLASCEEQIREQYKDRKKTIKKMHSLLVRGGADERIPADLLKQKMDAYERNEVVYDYMCRNELRFFQENAEFMINTFNEEYGTNISYSVSRTHGNFLWGKTNEEKVGLTRMGHQKGYARLEYLKAILTEMKSVDFKEFDHKDMAKFYDDFDRKAKVLPLYSNATDLKGIMKQALEEIRDQENKDRAERGEEPDHSPLEIPEMFREMGYANLEEFNIEMTVAQDVGNMIAGKFSSIFQTPTHGNMSYFSLQELGSLDAKKCEDMKKSMAAYKKRMEEKGISEDDDELQNDSIFVTADYVSEKTDYYNFSLPTRELSKKEKEQNKKNMEAGNEAAIIRQQRMTLDVDAVTIYREERQSHYLERIKKAREKQTPEQLLEEKNKAEKGLAKVRERGNSHEALLKKNGYDTNANYRRLVAYVSSMASLCSDSEEKSLKRAKALSIKPSKASQEQKTAMAKELESAFKVVMDFDIRKLNFQSFSDLLDETRDETALMVQFCFDATALFDYYEELMRDEETETLLNEEEFQEIRAKRDFIQSMQAFYDGLLIQMTKPMHQIVDSVSLLGLSDKEYRDFCEDFLSEENVSEIMKEYPGIIRPDMEVFFANLERVRRAMHEDMLYPGMNIEEVYRAKKKNSSVLRPLM